MEQAPLRATDAGLVVDCECWQEAGEGEDGRIKSSLGIGTLLEDGIGDTIRVSLTEEPECEIPIAKFLVNRYADRSKHDNILILMALLLIHLSIYLDNQILF